MDSKPSGPSGQLIQYNNQIWECYATHQTKYGRAESSLHYDTVCCNTEDLTHHGNSDIHYDNQEANIDTHNLLDALKEISRKRIHSENEDLHTHSSKQQRCSAGEDSNTNLTDSAIHVTDVPPVINSITASLSSAGTYTIYPKRGIKKKNLCIEARKSRQKHAVTQTDKQLYKSIQTRSNILNSNLERKKSVKTDVCKKSTIASSVVVAKLFNNTQFEIAKKNKLALLLSPLTGNKVKLLPCQPKAIKTDDNRDELLHSQIKPASIISPKNKPKHDKHVTFVIPEKENIVDISVHNLKNDSVPDADSVLGDSKNKIHYDKYLHSGQTSQVSNNVERESDGCAANKSNSAKNNSTYSKDQLFQSTPSMGYSSSEIPLNNESKTAVLMTDKFTSNKVPTTQVTSTNASNTSNSINVGGFKFDFKSNDTLQWKGSGSLIPAISDVSVKSQYSHANLYTTNSNPQTVSSSFTNMPVFSPNSPLPFSQVVDAYFNNEGNLKPKSYINTILDSKENASTYNSITNAKFNSSSSHFGGNTTVTSVGRSMLLSIGSGTSAIVTTTELPLSSSTCIGSLTSNSSMTPPTLNFDTNQTQPFGSKLAINSIKSSFSPSNSNFSSTGFGSSEFLNATPQHVINLTTNSTAGDSSTTNFHTNTTNNNAGTGLTSVNFGSILNSPHHKGKSNDLLPTTSTVFNLGNSFGAPIFTNNQFKQNSNAPTTGYSDNKITFAESPVKSNTYNPAISSENNIFGTRNNNSMGGNFTGFVSTLPQESSLFTSSSSMLPPQSETFTIGTSKISNTDMFTFGVQNDVSSMGKLNTSNVSPVFSTLPNSAFGSVATSGVEASTNSFCFSSNVGFNTLTYNNAVSPNFDSSTSRIFSIGSGTPYPKSRTQLRGRRRT